MADMFIGLTDYDWYTTLKNKNYDEVNFWRPGTAAFRALQPNDLFLFKLKKPYDAIVGGGFFVRYSSVPISLAWEAFGEKNGTASYFDFSERLRRYRERNGIAVDYPSVGCIILTEPFFLDEQDWIDPPVDWSYSIVAGKSIDPLSGEGKRIFRQIQEKLKQGQVQPVAISDEPRYAENVAKHRLGQGAFRVLVTDTYHRRCAISGEKTLPVLQAAHIKPYAAAGPHLVQNGILLRSDIHTLFDEGYLTITPNFRVEVSLRLKNDFGNGKIYYQYHGQKLSVLPDDSVELPETQFLSWHNENVFLG